MKLDRNTNRGGRGKYALVNMRKLIPVMDKVEAWDSEKKRTLNDPTDDELVIASSFAALVNRGIITLGNESPGDQFFVLKYKDRFTAPALHAYAIAVSATVRQLEGQPPAAELAEYAQEMFSQARLAETTGNRIPD